MEHYGVLYYWDGTEIVLNEIEYKQILEVLAGGETDNLVIKGEAFPTRGASLRLYAKFYMQKRQTHWRCKWGNWHKIDGAFQDCDCGGLVKEIKRIQGEQVEQSSKIEVKDRECLCVGSERN